MDKVGTKNVAQDFAIVRFCLAPLIICILVGTTALPAAAQTTMDSRENLYAERCNPNNGETPTLETLICMVDLEMQAVRQSEDLERLNPKILVESVSINTSVGDIIDVGGGLEIEIPLFKAKGSAEEQATTATTLTINLYPEGDITISAAQGLRLAEAIEKLKKAARFAISKAPYLVPQTMRYEMGFGLEKGTSGGFKFVVINLTAENRRSYGQKIAFEFSVLKN